MLALTRPPQSRDRINFRHDDNLPQYVRGHGRRGARLPHVVVGNNSNSGKSHQGAHQLGGAICDCSLILELMPVGLGLVFVVEVNPIATLINLLVNIKYP